MAGLRPAKMAVALTAFLVFLALLAACSATTSEHIVASPDGITFERVVGRGAVTGGFTINKDSLTLKPLK